MGKIRKNALHQVERGDILNHEGLLRIFASIKHPLRRDDLLRIGGLLRRDKRRLEGLLFDLAGEGRITRTPSGAWVSVGRLKSLTGRFFAHSGGGGFVTPDVSPPGTSFFISRQNKKGEMRRKVFVRGNARSDIFVHPVQVGDARHGDKVRVFILPGAQGKSFEGRIAEVLERAQSEVAVKVLYKTGDSYLCRTVDPRLNLLFRTDVSALSATPHEGELLSVIPGERLASDLWAAAANASFGRGEDACAQERLVKLNNQAPSKFPTRALEEAAAFSLNPEHEDMQGREDLTKFPFVTIDGSTARDFDDAIFVSRSEDGFCLRVAIADVTHYVRPATALDAEARERGNSWYFPLSVEPMLPPELSNGLCSLKPGVNRLTLVVETCFDLFGRPKASRFYQAFIRSAARLTYGQAQRLLDEEVTVTELKTKQMTCSDERLPLSALEADEPLPKSKRFFQVDAGIRASLKDAASLAVLLAARREERGSLDFDLPEAEYDFDATGRLRSVRRKERLCSHRLIEECMIAANETTACFLEERNLPLPYRVHSVPDPERLSALFRSLRAVELTQKAPRRPSAKDLSVFLRAARGTPQEFLVGRLCLRAMMQAVYQQKNEGHFGLASQAYCHATSPIRRYADILVHRALKNALGLFPGPLVSGSKLTALADHLSRCERAAAGAEREIARRLAVLLLAERVGESFDAVISSVREFGFFAEFVDMPIEGLVRRTDMRDDIYEFDPDNCRFLGRNTGRRFSLGQKIRVMLAAVHTGRLEINLKPESSCHPSPNRGCGQKAYGIFRSARHPSPRLPREKKAKK